MQVSDIPEIFNLTVPKKILLVEEIWDTIATDAAIIPIPQSHIEELDRRFEHYKADPGKLLSLDELQAKVNSKK